MRKDPAVTAEARHSSCPAQPCHYTGFPDLGAASTGRRYSRQNERSVLDDPGYVVRLGGEPIFLELPATEAALPSGEANGFGAVWTRLGVSVAR
jgi:hypothetical protein